jgi:predicted nuclease of predicted toxin-antitoxin system
MQFLVDECVGSSVATFLKNQNHNVFSVFDQWRGATDDDILEKCLIEKYILITSDKDFGEMIYNQQKPHHGIILIRCEPNKFSKKIEVLEKLLRNYFDKLENNFVVVTNNKVRIIEGI